MVDRGFGGSGAKMGSEQSSTKVEQAGGERRDGGGVRSLDCARRRKIVRGRLEIKWGNSEREVVRNALFEQDNLDPATLAAESDSRLSPRAFRNERVIYVVTAALNAASYIDSTISSVISQEGRFHIRYHVKDGGSTDGTLEKLQKWSELLVSPDLPLVRCLGVTFSYATGRDGGLYDAINRGFAHLRPEPGGICTWINADDVYAGGAFASALGVFEGNPDCHWIVSVVNGCGSNQEDLSCNELQFPREIVRAGLCDQIHWPFIQQEGSFWSTELWAAAGGVDSRYRLAADWDLWRRFANLTPPVHVMWPLGKFRIHEDQLSAVSMSEYMNEIHRTIPAEIRDERMGKILARRLSPVMTVTRANHRVPDFTGRQVPVSRRFVRPTEAAGDLLEKYFRMFDPRNLRVLTISSMADGGAGTGSVRRIYALRSIGIEARLLSLVSHREEEFIGRLVPALDVMDCTNQGEVWKYVYQQTCRPAMGSAGFRGYDLFSNTESVLDFRQLAYLFDRYDILHFHWTVGMLDYSHLAEAVGDKPIVWTTADMNAFTGGCHYSEGCTGYTRECEECPLVPANPALAHRAWKVKKETYEKLNITVVCPSEDTASLVRKSTLLGERDVVVIPNAYPVDLIKPVERAEARSRLGLPLDKKLVMFAAYSIHNRRKGGDLLKAIATLLKESPHGTDTEVICAGRGSAELALKTHVLGQLDEEEMSLAYSAANVFILPSREDNAPLTATESLLCGTPFVGFEVGHLQEVTAGGRAGICVPVGDVCRLVESVGVFLDRAADEEETRRLCRDIGVRYGDPMVSAVRHKRLYEKLLNRGA